MLFGEWTAYCDEHYPLIDNVVISEAIRFYHDYPDFKNQEVLLDFEDYTISNNLLIFQLSSSLRAELEGEAPLLQIPATSASGSCRAAKRFVAFLRLALFCSRNMKNQTQKTSESGKIEMNIQHHAPFTIHVTLDGQTLSTVELSPRQSWRLEQ